ncbi:hypothetical protein SUNI508_10138 [Seiridium unicorne]|uniref:Uncharacterized protein n=1 Tax=Seiridium unicorne TaxID=138068 RepID=A0ABR2UMG6_9PEZI
MFAKLTLLLHILIETPAAFTFIFTPEKQLHDCNSATRLVLRQYGGLLISSNLISVVLFSQEELGDAGRLIAASLGFYHIWPCYRAYARLTRQVSGDIHGQATLGGPAVHLAVHIILLGMFGYVAISDVQA